MATFKYEGHDAYARPKHGTIEAETPELAAGKLRDEGIFVMNMVPKGATFMPVLPRQKSLSGETEQVEGRRQEKKPVAPLQLKKAGENDGLEMDPATTKVGADIPEWMKKIGKQEGEAFEVLEGSPGEGRPLTSEELKAIDERRAKMAANRKEYVKEQATRSEEEPVLENDVAVWDTNQKLVEGLNEANLAMTRLSKYVGNNISDEELKKLRLYLYQRAVLRSLKW